MISLVSAEMEFDNRKDFDKNIGRYGKYEIKEWFGMKKLIDIELKENTEECVMGCEAVKEIAIHEKGVLIEDIYFYNVKKRYNQTLDYQILINKNNKWQQYNLGGEVNKGTYQIKLQGNKQPYETIDWVIKSNGYWLTDWAMWGSGSDLLLYYDLEETSGLVIDREGGTNNGTANNVSRQYDGVITYGYGFNATNNYINFTAINMTENWTISMWVNATTDIAGSVMPIGSNVGANGYFIQWQSTNFRVYGDGVHDTEDVAAGRGINYNNFEHWVIRYNGTDMDFFINNTRLGSSSEADFDMVLNNIGDTYTGGADFNGTIDEVGIWNKSLTNAEIENLWNGGSGMTYGGVSLSVTQNLPVNAFTSVNKRITFNCSSSITGVDNVENISLYLDGSENYVHTHGTSNSTSFEEQITVDGLGSHNWYCLAVSNNSDEATSGTRTFTLEDYITSNPVYNTSSFETKNESFFLNVSYDLNFTTVSANLWYNGTGYTTYKSYDNGSIATFENSLDVPINNHLNGLNKSFHWEVSLTNSSSTTLYNVSKLNQTVSGISFGIRNESLDNTFLNISFRDETSLADINASIPLSAFGYYIGSGSINKSISYTSTLANDSYIFGFNPLNETLNLDAYVQYSSSSYPQRTYNPEYLVYTNLTTNITLYLLHEDDGIYVTFQVLTQAEQPIEGVFANASREIEGSTVVVGSGTTGADGAITFWLNPDYAHDFVFEATGYGDYETTITPTQSSYTITLGGGITTAPDYSQEISFFIEPISGFLYNNTQYNFNFTISSTYWSLDSYGFILEYDNGTEIGSVSGSTGTGGTERLDADTSTADRVYMYYFYETNSTFNNGSRYWIMQTDIGSEFSIFHFFEDLTLYIDANMFGISGTDGTDTFGRALISFLILVLTVGVLSYRYGIQSEAAIMGIIFGIVLFLDVGIGLIPNPELATNAGISNFATIITGLLLIGMLIREELK